MTFKYQLKKIKTNPFSSHDVFLIVFADKGLLNGLLYVQIHSGRGFHKNGNPFNVNKKCGFLI